MRGGVAWCACVHIEGQILASGQDVSGSQKAGVRGASKAAGEQIQCRFENVKERLKKK